MIPQTHLGNLSDDDALSLRVGRVARTHALLEYSVDNVRRLLARREGEVPQSTSSVKGFDQLARECSERLRESKVDQCIVDAGEVALKAARQATAERNRVVHDMWLPAEPADDSGQPRWNTFRRSGDFRASYNSADAQDLDMIAEVHTVLLRTRIRVSGLFMALHALWPAESPEPKGPVGDNMANYIDLMMDRFTLHPNGDFEVT